MESSFICMDHSSFYPRPGLETDMGITCIFLSVYFISQVYLPLKMKIWCLPSLQEDWQIVPFIYCCCGVMRHALYFWRLSKKLFTSQYIQNRSHLGHKSILGKFKKIEIISSIFSNFKLWDYKINYKKKLKKSWAHGS